MRSSPSGPDPLDPGPTGFAHRGLHSGSVIPENGLAAFAAALDLGAGIECDLRLTADGRIVTFHDADASRLCASPLRIGRSTLEQLGQLRVGDQPIPTLEDLLTLVAGRVPLLLEIKVDGDIGRWIPALRRDLDGYDGRFGAMSFDPRLPRLLRVHLPKVRRGLVVRDRLASLKRGLYRRFAAPDFLAIERETLGKPWTERARRLMPVYGWTIRTAAERAQASVHADTLIWEGDGRPRI